MRLDATTCRRLFISSPVARLATVGTAGPHLVPIVFALHDDTIVTAVDAKPKSTRRLQRLANLADDPHAAVLVDRYDPDWQRLWWVRADGEGTVHDDLPGVTAGVELLALRYPQYREHPPEGPVVRIAVRRWTGWAASEAAILS